MKTAEGRSLGSFAAVFTMAVVMLYGVGYLALRQTAAKGTIFITPTGSKVTTASDYRAINLSPMVSKWVHRIYSPAIMLDRKWSGTVVTVNVP